MNSTFGQQTDVSSGEREHKFLINLPVGATLLKLTERRLHKNLTTVKSVNNTIFGIAQFLNRSSISNTYAIGKQTSQIWMMYHQTFLLEGKIAYI
jgi:hypothetical protein